MPSPPSPQRRRGFQHRAHRPLPLWLRVLLLAAGWILVLIGIAGLVLPGIQGVLTLLLAAAVLSLVSEIAYEVLRKSFRPWPRGWRRVLKLRRWMHRRLHRAAFDKEASAPAADPDQPDPGDGH